METDRKWIVVRIDGKIASVSTDYRMLARISDMLACHGSGKTGMKAGKETVYGEISAKAVCFDEVWRLRQEACWEDLMLFGTDFQKKVWRKLWELTHMEETAARQDADNSDQDKEAPSHTCSGTDTTNTKTPTGQATRLVSYSDFAELCQNRAGVRAVAHAIGLNPVSVIIPCHLVIPKEGIDKIREIHNRAQSTIFKGDDLCIGSILADTSIDFGEYALGKSMKRELIIREITEKSV
jgi:O6-methylguanine-DNA--protein-cysteine methyltransferase